jgi:hypothetical protein
VQLSEAVDGFTFLPVSGLGQQVFAGTVTQGDETHTGVGVLTGSLVVGATLAGYEPSPENVASLLGLAGAGIQTAAGVGAGSK